MIQTATSEEKTTKYLNGNPIVKRFIDEVNTAIELHYKTDLHSLKFHPVVVEIGSRFIRICHDSSCWGFISRVDGKLRGTPIKKGDLLKSASWSAPAKHARGNIIEGTAQWGVYGPSYIK